MADQDNPQAPAAPPTATPEPTPAAAPAHSGPSGPTPTRFGSDRPGGGGGRSHSGPPRGDSRGPREGGGPGGPPRRGKRQFFRKRKVCHFCTGKIDFIDYKKADALNQFIQDRGKILPRRMTGTCSRHQRWLCEAIKRARNIALLPFATEL
ncbi:MAG: 30S ribosomal protein S18 [Candidatus Acidiferrales bacterium]